MPFDDFDIPISSILDHIKRPSATSVASHKHPASPNPLKKDQFAKIDEFRRLLTEAGTVAEGDKTYATSIPANSAGRKRRGKTNEPRDEFGRTPSEIRKARIALNTQAHKDLQKDAYENYSPAAGWQQTAHITVIQHQHCNHCGGRVDSIAAELTRVTHPRYRNGLTADVQRVHEVCDPSVDLLPHIITEGNVRVEECASCITLRNLVTSHPLDLNAIGMPPYRQLTLLQ